MANAIRLNERQKIEDPSIFSGHTGDVYIEVMSAQDNAFTHWRIFAASPTASNFNDAPTGSWLIDTADGTFRIKTAATTWVTVTTS